MADKIFLKYFSKDFTGINAECSAIEPEGDEVSRAVNLEWALSNNLRGRTGKQLAAAAGCFDFMYTHSYSRTTPKYVPKFQIGAAGWTPGISSTAYAADGATVTELMAFNQDVWILDNLEIPITVTGGPKTVTWWAESDPANSRILVKLTSASDTFTFNANTGLDVPTNSYTLYHLINGAGTGINASAYFSVAMTRATLPPFGIVSGNQTPATLGFVTNFGYTYRFTLNAGHTFNVGDPICFQDNAVTSSCSLLSGFVTAINTAGTNVTFALGDWNYALDVKDGQVLGYLCNPAAAIPITAKRLEGSVSTFNLVVPYWRSISYNRYSHLYLGHNVMARYITLSETYYKQRTATSALGCCYFAHTNNTSYPESTLQKYDGQTISDAGCTTPTIVAASQASALGTLTGTFKYKTFKRRIDAQGNIIDGTPTETKTFTITAGVSIVRLWTGVPTLNKGFLNGAFAPAGTNLVVDDGAAGLSTFKVGDPICYIDSTSIPSWAAPITVSATPVLRRGWITGERNGVEFQLDNMAYGIADNAWLSQAETTIILRTVNGGNTYYYHSEWPSSAQSFDDNLSDALLGANARFIEAEIGKEHNPPGFCSLVTQHQGGLVIAGARTTPNQVEYSTGTGIEYFPTASNSFNVPSTVKGPITALASDTVDRLAVFKEDSYFDVSGDLDGGSFSIQVITEGSFGIASQNTLQRIKDGILVGLSNLGFVIVSNGRLDEQTFRTINARIIDQNWFVSRATATIDAFKRNYVCTIPKTNNYKDGNTTLVLDYSRARFANLEQDYNLNLQPTHGFSIYNDSQYSLNGYRTALTNVGGTVWRSLERFTTASSPTGDAGDSYIDHIYAIPYILETQAINFGEPSVLKTPIRLRTFSIPNENIIEGWVPWSCVVTTTIFPDTAYLGSGYPGGTTSTITFADTKNYFKDIKLVQSKCLLYIIRFTTNVIRQAPFFTGYEILFSDSYKKEDLGR